MLLKIHPENPSEREVFHIAEALRNGAVIIYPTDTVYAFGCDIFQTKAIEKICHLKKIDARKAKFSIVCADLSGISEFAKVDNTTFKLMKKNLPGAFTFILNGNSNLPKLFKNRKTIGIRVPKNNIAQKIVEALGHPILSSSLKKNDDEQSYMTDPESINEQYGKITDLIINGGLCGKNPSTVIDCTGDEPVITRQSEAIPIE